MGTASARPNEAADQARVFRALHEVALATGGVLDPARLARLAVDHARDLVGAWSSTLVWYEEGDGLSVLADNHEVEFPQSGLGPGQGLSGQIRITGDVVVVDDYPAWQYAIDWAVEGGVRSMAGVPLKVHDKVVGSLLVRSAERGFFGSALIDVLLLLAAQVAPALEAASLSAERERHGRVFEALHELAVVAGGVLDPAELAREAAERCRELLGVEGTVVFHHDRASGLLVPLHESGSEVVDKSIKPGEGAIGLAFRRRRAYAVADYAGWQHHLDGPVSRGLAAGLSYPLVAGDQAIGAIGVWASTPRTWTERDVQILSLVAAQIGPALNTATLALERLRQSETLVALNEVAVAAAGVLEPSALALIAAERAQLLLKADGGSATWFDEDEGAVRVLADTDGDASAAPPFPVSEAGAQGIALETGEPVVIEDYRQWNGRVETEMDRVASCLVVPLLVRQRRIGSLAVSYRTRRSFSAEDVQLMTLLAAEIAPSLEAARLHADLRESEARKRSIVESALDCVVAVDEEGRIVEFNPAAERTFGRRRRDVIGQPLWDLIIPARLREQHMAGMAEFGRSEKRALGRRLETTALRADGTEFPVELAMSAFTQDGRMMFSASIRDLSDRVEVETVRQESEAKSRFVAAMSHELRTPLNSILGFSQLLSGSGTGDLNERQQRYVGHIESSGRHLLALINDVLDLSKVEAGQMEVEVEPIELQPVLDEAVTQMKPIADAKSVDLLLDPMIHIWIRADRRRFLQVMLNLLSNAVKFTPSGGLVRVVASRAGRMAKIAVIDTGIGIPEAEKQRIFEEFTQIERPAAEQPEGTGLGLALSRRLLVLMRGRITVESTEGQGSTFTVSVPRIRPGEVADARPLLLIVQGPEDDPGLFSPLELGPYRVLATATVREAAIIARRRRLAGIVVGEQVRPADIDWLREALRDHPRTHSLPILTASVALHPGVLIRD